MNIKLFSSICNTYVISNNGIAIIFDLGLEDINPLLDYIKNNDLVVKAIYLTHGHFDHFLSLQSFLNVYKVDVYLHEKDFKLLRDGYLNCSSIFIGEEITFKGQVKFIKDNDVIDTLQNHCFKVLHTPYHSQGSCCFYFYDDKILFSGDSLFLNSIGNYNLPSSSFSDIKPSLNKILSLPDDVVVYPGHGNKTTIKNEKKLLSY